MKARHQNAGGDRGGRPVAGRLRAADPPGAGQAGLRALAAASPAVATVRQLQLIEGRRAAQDRGAGPIQRRKLSGHERTQLEVSRGHLKAAIAEFAQLEAEMDALAQYHATPAGGDVPEEIATAYEKLAETIKGLKDAGRTAHQNDGTFTRFRAQMNAYWFSGGRNALKNIRAKLAKLEKQGLDTERNDLGEITGFDEIHFAKYLAKSKSPMTVYRGDGRNVNAESLENFQPHEVEAGGTPDITFYGVVQHTHSNAYKNGMVSTTWQEADALHWAIANHNYGIVYTFELSNPIHVATLLAARNFKDRYPGQREVLAPGNIPAKDMVRAQLYQKADNTVIATWTR